MTEILELIEPGEYPPGTDAATAAALSQAVSLKRIADMMGNLAFPLVTAPAPIAPARLVVGGGKSASAPKPTEASLAAGRPIPDEPVQIPHDFIPHDGSAMPVQPLDQVTVIWRNGHVAESAAQQVIWKWGPTTKAHDILAWRAVPKDPALFSQPNPALNVPMNGEVP